MEKLLKVVMSTSEGRHYILQMLQDTMALASPTSDAFLAGRKWHGILVLNAIINDEYLHRLYLTARSEQVEREQRR